MAAMPPTGSEVPAPAPERPRVAVVTGGGAGIGRAAARRLADEGWTVVVAGRTGATLEASCDRPGMHPVLADVTSDGSVAALFEAAGALGEVRLCLVNAGVPGPVAEFGDLAAEEFADTVAVNLTGAFRTAAAAFRAMRDQDPPGGRIIVNASIAAQVPRPRSAAYAASKAGLAGLTRVLALDGRAHGIAATRLDVGNAATGLLAGFGVAGADPAPGTRTPPGEEGPGALQPDGSHLVEPSFDVAEVARAVCYLAALPAEATVDQLTLTAAGMPFLGRG